MNIPCTDITGTTDYEVSAGAVVRLNVTTANEERHFLYLTDGNVAVSLASAFSSGVGGFSHSLESAPLTVADVYGDARPEVWTIVNSAWNDTDMGVCEIHGSHEEKLVLCTQEDGGPACFDLPLVQVEHDEVYGEPGSGCAKPRLMDRGFAFTAEVTQGKVTLRPHAGVTLTHKIKAPFSGEVPMATLFEKAKATMEPLPE